MKLKPIKLEVSPGTKVTIIVPDVHLHKGKEFDLVFFLTCPAAQTYSTITSTEAVYIQTGGVDYQLLDKAADIFYGGLLHRDRCYRIRFGNNGLPGKVKHFINLDSPRCARPYDPNNAIDGPTADPGGEG